MTYEEAKNLIDDITWKYNGNSITNEMICECRDKCREALEKNIPKQIIRRISKEEENRIYHHCDICGERMTRMTNYCPNCGQAIDWRSIK